MLREGSYVMKARLILLLLCSALSASAAASVTLAWDASPDASVTGYRIYFGPASGAYTNSVAVGNVTNATLTNLKAGAIYYFAATAHDGSGLESAFSNETSYTPPLPPLPQVTGFRAVIASLARFLGFSAG